MTLCALVSFLNDLCVFALNIFTHDPLRGPLFDPLRNVS